MEQLLKLIRSGEYDKIEGWCTKEKALKMIEYISPRTMLCVELGVFGGRSLLPIALANKNGVTVGIDAWSANSSIDGENDDANDEWWKKIDYDGMFKYTIELLKRNGCSNTKLLREESSKAVDRFKNNSIDFLHQDSNHSEKISCAEVELYKNKVKQGGIWVFDDTNWETTRKAQELLAGYGYIEIYDSGTWKIYKRMK